MSVPHAAASSGISDWKHTRLCAYLNVRITGPKQRSACEYEMIPMKSNSRLMIKLWILHPGVVAVLSALLVGTGCGTTNGGPQSLMPDREESDLFTTQQAGFMIIQHPEAQQPEIRYRLRLSPNQEIQQPLMLQITFQNPENPNQPLVERQEIEAGLPSFEIESGSIWGLRRDEVYEVAIEAYDGVGNRIGVHRQGVLSTIDTRYPDLGRR